MGASRGWPGDEGFIRPYALFCGVVCSFLACCVAGHVASRHNLFDHFERLHLYLNPDACFYPTSSQLYELGKARLDPQKIAVVVGGNSVLYGVGQVGDEIWTHKLQDLLGDDYCVLNLAMWGCSASEFGGVVAEALSTDFPRLVLVTTSPPANFPGDADGMRYPYLFWDAYYVGLLRHDSARDKALAALPAERANLRSLAEMRGRAILNSACRFDDLWTAVSYSRFSTVWNAAMRETWYRPRRDLQDPGTAALPLETRYSDHPVERWLTNLHTWMAAGGARKDSAGHWVDDPSAAVWTTLTENACRCFPEPDRRRSLIVINTISPHYIDCLPPDERDLHYTLSRLTAEKLEGAGFAALDFGDEFTEQDFADPIHLTPSGGARLARKVAERIRRMAVELGFAHGAGVQPSCEP